MKDYADKKNNAINSFKKKLADIQIGVSSSLEEESIIINSQPDIEDGKIKDSVLEITESNLVESKVMEVDGKADNSKEDASPYPYIPA